MKDKWFDHLVQRLIDVIPDNEGWDLCSELVSAKTMDDICITLESYLPDSLSLMSRWQKRLLAVLSTRHEFYAELDNEQPGAIMVKWDTQLINVLFDNIEDALVATRSSELYRTMPEARDDFLFFEVIGKGGGHTMSTPTGVRDQFGQRVINGVAVKELGRLLKDDK